MNFNLNQFMTPEEQQIAAKSFETQTITRMLEAGLQDQIAAHLARDEHGNYTHSTTMLRWSEFIMGAIHSSALHSAVQSRYVMYRKFIEVLCIVGNNAEESMTPDQKAIHDAFDKMFDVDTNPLTLEKFDAFLMEAVFGVSSDTDGLAAAPGVLAGVQPANDGPDHCDGPASEGFIKTECAPERKEFPDSGSPSAFVE